MGEIVSHFSQKLFFFAENLAFIRISFACEKCENFHFFAKKFSKFCEKMSLYLTFINPIHAWGGGIWPPVVFFLHFSKSIYQIMVESLKSLKNQIFVLAHFVRFSYFWNAFDIRKRIAQVLTTYLQTSYVWRLERTRKFKNKLTQCLQVRCIFFLHQTLELNLGTEVFLGLLLLKTSIVKCFRQRDRTFALKF